MMTIEFDEKISFKGKFVNGRAKDVFTNFDHSRLIVKAETGMGGTTAVLNYTGGNVILIIPNVSVIEGKMNPKLPYDSGKQYFIFYDGDSHADDWNDVRKAFYDNVQNMVIVSTPDNLVKAKDVFPDLYDDLLKHTPLFLDEFHTYITDRNFRSKLGRFSALVYNEWNAPVIMSTATPNYRLFDIPGYFPILKTYVYPEIPRRKNLKISGAYTDAKKFILEECEKGNKVAVFTNISNILKDDYGHYKVRYLLGSTLERKLAKKGIEQALPKEEDFLDADIFMHSSAYFVGYDFLANASVLVASDQRFSAHTISLQNFIQAYGRCREEIINSLFINMTSKHKFDLKGDYSISENQEEIDCKVDSFICKTSKVKGTVLDVLNAFPDEFNKEDFTIDHYYDLTVEGSNIQETIVNFQLFNSEQVKKYLENRNFELTEYHSDYQVKKSKKKVNFKTTFLNYLQRDEHFLLGMYNNSKENIRYGGEGANSWEESFEFLTGILLKKLQPATIIQKLSTSITKKEFYTCLYKFLRANFCDLEYSHSPQEQVLNAWRRAYPFEFSGSIGKVYLREWFMFFTMYQLRIFKIKSENAEHLPPEIAQKVDFYDTISTMDIFEKLVGNRKNRNNLAKREIYKRLDEKKIEVQNNLKRLEVLKIQKEIFKHLDKKKKYNSKYNREAIIQTMQNVLIYLVNKGQGHFAQKSIDSRTYGPITNLPRSLRQIIPLKYVELDVRFANAQFVDDMIGSKIAKGVYENVMENYDLSRDEAKVIYNYVLNAWYIPKPQVKEMLLTFGYSQIEVENLTPLVSTINSGEFFREVTAKEKELIDAYMDYLKNIETHRLHDCMVIPIWDAQRVKLPLKFKDYEFHVSLFNSEETYDGEVIEMEEGEHAILYLNSIDTYWGTPLV